MNPTNTERLMQFKAAAQANQMIPRKFFLHEIKLIDNSTIDINGVYLHLEPRAFKDLIGILGMNEKIMKVFDTNFGEDKTKAVLSLIQENISRSGLGIMLYANPKQISVSRIVVENKQLKGLGLDTYFNTVERMLNDNPDFIIKRTIADPSQTQIDLMDPKAEFKIAGKNLETFHPGLSFGTAFNQPSFIQNFTERLVCSNGMVHRDTATAYSLNENFNKEQWVKFFEHIDNVKKNGWISPAFNQKVENAMTTSASLAEMQHMASMLRSHAGSDVNLWVPITETVNRFKGIGVDPDTLNTNQLQTAKTGTSVWELVNAITDFASHDYNYKITDMQKLNMQVAAGKLLMKDSFDMQNVMTKSPF